MNLLWTTHGLARPGGTEMFTRDCVPELIRRGHRVEILTSRPGLIADQMRQNNVIVHESPESLRGPFDLIHGQHYLESVIALTVFPELPMIFYCHGNPDRGWIEQPPLHPNCLRLLTNCSNLAAHLQRTRSIAGEKIGVVANGFDPDRFKQVRPAPAALRNAVFFHNTLTHASPEWQAAEAACRQCGIHLEAIGSEFGRPVDDPENVLPDFDLVFAFGRSALEALVSGCAVMLTGLLRSGGLLNEDDLDALLRSNFTRGRRELEISEENFTAELLSWDPARTAPLARHLRQSHTLGYTVDQLESEYQQIIRRAGELAEIDPAEKSRTTAIQLHHAWLHFAEASTTAGSAQRRFQREREKHDLAKRQLAEAKQRLKIVEKVLTRGWLRRPAWQALQRHWAKLDKDLRS